MLNIYRNTRMSEITIEKLCTKIEKNWTLCKRFERDSKIGLNVILILLELSLIKSKKNRWKRIVESQLGESWVVTPCKKSGNWTASDSCFFRSVLSLPIETQGIALFLLFTHLPQESNPLTINSVYIHRHR